MDGRDHAKVTIEPYQLVTGTATKTARVDATITLKPVELAVSLKELPERRTHLPADFTVGLSLLGVQLMCVRLCGEAQMVSENYHPNPCERCGDVTTRSPDEG